MIHNSRELRASLRALRLLEHALKHAGDGLKSSEARVFMEEQIHDLMRPIRRDMRKYMATK